ncbi:MAG TPA: DMT family transporter [Streptosporangiaceae bacterium]
MAASDMLIAIPGAVGAAACFGITAVLQHRATQRTPTRHAMNPRLVIDLLRQPLWVGAIFLNVLGTLLQVLALRFGPLIMVQPLLVTGLLFSVVIGSFAAGRRPDRVLLGGAFCCIAGLAVFLVVAHPTPGRETLTLDAMLPLVIALSCVLALCLAVSSRGHGQVPALALGVAAGVLYGVTAGFIKVVTHEFSISTFEPLHGWTLYALLIIGPLGFLLNQNAYQVAAAASPVLAVITIVDPIVGIIVGRLWLGEHVNLGLGALAGQIAALAVMAAGIGLLAHRAPHLREAVVPGAVAGSGSAAVAASGETTGGAGTDGGAATGDDGPEWSGGDSHARAAS